MRYINQPVEKGIILNRVIVGFDGQTTVATNVEHKIVYHSPTGFEWGYNGSGPSELALNLAELVVQKAELVTPSGVHCTELAWHTKHSVKELLVSLVPEEGGFIPWKLVCYAVLDA
jgi:hypothetical protein